MSDENKKGFSGLSGLLSDVKLDDVTPKDQPSPASPSDPPESPPEEKRAELYKDTSKPNSGVKKFWWIAGGLFLIWIIAQGDNSKSTYSTPSQTSTGYSNSASAFTNEEEKPPAGTNLVLSRAQIRYCLSEKTRMSAAESMVNRYSDAEITLFNDMVADYNNRCGSYRYRPGSLEAVRAEVAANQINLLAEAKRKVQGWRASETPVAGNAALNQPATETAPPTTILSPELYLGKYKYEYNDASYSESSTLTISRAQAAQSVQDVYKISIHLASPYCSGDVEAYGYPVQDVFGFVSNDEPGCVLAAKLDQSSQELQIVEVKNCSKWHGAKCTFTGKYQRAQEADASSVTQALTLTPSVGAQDNVPGVDTLPDPVLTKAVAEVAGQLPMKMDDMTLEAVKAEGKKTLVYMYRLVGDAKNFDATEATTNISKHWCKSAEGADFRKIDAVILYRYFDSQGAPVQEIKIKTKDCK